MRWVRAVVALVLAAAIFWALDNRHGTFPALGKLLSPFAGFWQNGSRSDAVPKELVVPGLREEVRIVWDTRHVPHLFARNDHDLYLAQGYVAASLRLWQMDFQALYSAGRISEVVGPAGLSQDIFIRRLGLAWAAEKALRAFRDEPRTREALRAFTAGVNACLHDLGRKGLPVEYKILDYRPEPWTDYKSALLLKAMALILASFNQDAAMTEMRDQGSGWEEFINSLFPLIPPLVDPIIPPGTPLDFAPLPVPTRGAPETGDRSKTVSSSAASRGFESPGYKIGPGIGSNNWAVSGKLARNGYPILCNDIHLGLSLPSIWYEIQLSAPGIDVRGVSFPSAPMVIAGYNENVAWGFTAGLDDVLDWYDITFKDDTRTEYLYGGEWRKAKVLKELIRVRGGADVVDRVVFTHHGPIVRWKDEPAFAAMNVPAGAALRWLAHDPSNELLTLFILNRARNYSDFVQALETWDCPAHNIVYADRGGTIAIWHNGKYPLRWKGQGRYVLDGSDPADDWQGWVPRGHVPHVRDPERGFVSSANQLPVDASYPYYLGWNFAPYERGARINELLGAARDVTPQDMVRMQTDILDVRARAVLPRLVDIIWGTSATDEERKSCEELRAWNCEARATLVAPTIFREFWNELNRLTWDDEKTDKMERMIWPESQVMVDLILSQPDAEYYDDRTTAKRETLVDIAAQAFRTAIENLKKRLGPYGDAWLWGRAKGTSLGHLAQIPGFGWEKLETDGVSHVINAIDASWGPSWRMVVELGPEVKAWGNYPGGQSGHPGSKFYDNFIEDWAAGKPDELVFLKSADELNPRVVRRTVMRGGK